MYAYVCPSSTFVEAIRHLAGKCLCLITKEKAHDFLAPLQLRVGGAEKIIHGLRCYVDD